VINFGGFITFPSLKCKDMDAHMKTNAFVNICVYEYVKIDGNYH